MKQALINHILYNGSISLSQRTQYVNNYLKGKNKIMLLSPVGFEGLDLYGTTHIIIVDPHYNPERTTQLISRATRAFTNIEKLEIIKIQSISKNIKIPLIDEIIENIAKRKSEVAKIIENTLITKHK